jgi:hypothetical protein
MERRLVAAMVLAFLCLAGWVAYGLITAPPPTFTITDIDGPNVVVTPWLHGPATSVACEGGAQIDTKSAPGQPWLVTVTSAATGKVLRQESLSGDVEVIVRTDAVFIGPPAPSAGPAPLPGFECPGSP